MEEIVSAYAHQIETTNFIVNNKKCLITSDPGTGKTRSVLDAHTKLGSTTLVLAPLSILEASWLPMANINQYIFQIITNMQLDQ